MDVLSQFKILTGANLHFIANPKHDLNPLKWESGRLPRQHFIYLRILLTKIQRISNMVQQNWWHENPEKRDAFKKVAVRLKRVNPKG